MTRKVAQTNVLALIAILPGTTLVPSGMGATRPENALRFLISRTSEYGDNHASRLRTSINFGSPRPNVGEGPGVRGKHTLERFH